MEHLHASILEDCPKEREDELDRILDIEIRKNPAKIVALDDDPTGVQTVHGVSVYTDWEPDSIARGFDEPQKLFFILTNSRGMTAAQSEKAHREIGAVVARISREKNTPVIFMSRSDSTLRGHYPLETEILAEELEKDGVRIDGEIICPYFREGGRFTINDVHYVRYGDELVPAGETEFAKDKTFGYRSSNLRDYVEEKTAGNFKAKDVVSISLDELRSGDFDSIEATLMAVANFGKVIVNATNDCDVKAFCVPLYRAMARGKRFIFRTAAALVKALGGISTRPLLTRAEMVSTGKSENGGIVVVGSHTQKTTSQLEKLLELAGVTGIEFNSDLVLDGDAALDAEVSRVVKESEKLIREGKTPVCYTRRKLLSLENDTRENALLRSVRISQAVRDLVGKLKTTPAFVIAKGGITSSDVGVKALGVKRATVLGQIQPGVPVWRTDSQSRFPGIPYVIFPGNVGEVDTLKEAVEVLLE